MEIKIEASVVPDNLKLRGRPNKYPFDKMRPGDKISIKVTDGNFKRIRDKIVGACHGYKQWNNLKWVTASAIEGEYVVLYRIS